MPNFFGRAALVAVVAGGCYAQAGYHAGYTATVVAPRPALSVVAPGVQVVQTSYDYPVFFNGGMYWRYDGGRWYSSRMYTGGWAPSYNVPVAVSRIDRPMSYSHYRGGAVTPAYRSAPTAVVRAPAPAVVRTPPAAAARQAPVPTARPPAPRPAPSRRR